MILLSPARANDDKLKTALAPLKDAISIATMREANLRASGNDASSSSQAVARWLWNQIKHP